MKRILARGGLLLSLMTLMAATGCGPHSPPMGGPPPGAPEVYVAVPISRSITDYEEFPGRLESDQTVMIRARVTGYLKDYHFKEGGLVEKGQVMFEIDSALYEAELALAEGNVREAEGQYEQARADIRRALELRVPTEISAEDVTKYRGAYVMSEGKLKAARATLKKAQVNMDYTKVKAPFAGRVGKNSIDVGNLVRADDTILTSLGKSNPIKATFDLDERTLARILRLIKEGVLPKDFTGTPVEMWLADEDMDSAKPQKGKIDFTDNSVDSSTGTYRVRGAFDNKDDLLVPGMFVRVRVPIGIAKPEVLVEEKALVTDQGQKFIYVVKEENLETHEGTVEYRQVQIGRLHEGLRVIKKPLKRNEKDKGLEPNEKVVVSGLQRLRPGLKFKFKDVQMKPTTPPPESKDPTKAENNKASGSSSRTPPVIVSPPIKHEKGSAKKKQ